MNLSMALKQARDGIASIIKQNPSALVIYRRRMVDNGFNKMVADPFDSSPSSSPITGRVSKERKGPEPGVPINSGLSTAGSFYLLVEHNVTIYKNDAFEWAARRWRLDAVSQIESFGGVIAYEAPLIQAEQSEVDT